MTTSSIQVEITPFWLDELIARVFGQSDDIDSNSEFWNPAFPGTPPSLAHAWCSILFDSWKPGWIRNPKRERGSLSIFLAYASGYFVMAHDQLEEHDRCRN